MTKQPRRTDAERVRLARGAGSEQSYLRQPWVSLGRVSAGVPRSAGAVEPDDDEEVSAIPLESTWSLTSSTC